MLRYTSVTAWSTTFGVDTYRETSQRPTTLSEVMIVLVCYLKDTCGTARIDGALWKLS